MHLCRFFARMHLTHTMHMAILNYVSNVINENEMSVKGGHAMFLNFFSLLRNGIRDAVLGGLEDAHAEIERRATEARAPTPQQIEPPAPVNRIASGSPNGNGRKQPSR